MGYAEVAKMGNGSEVGYGRPLKHDYKATSLATAGVV